jgi:hypothetical protein
MVRPPNSLTPSTWSELCPWLELDAAEIVLIPPLTVYQFAEQALPHHVENRHDVTSIADILHDHAWHARLL